jgi:hypothetical protein
MCSNYEIEILKNHYKIPEEKLFLYPISYNNIEYNDINNNSFNNRKNIFMLGSY